MKYHCECCDFHSSNKKDYNRHCLTAKHKSRINHEENEIKPEENTPNNYNCETCDFHTSKKTDYTIHCMTAKHKKRCSWVKPIEIAETVAVVVQEHNSESSRESKDYNLIVELVKENKEFENLLVEQHKMVTELQTQIIEMSRESKTITTTNTNTNSNNTTNNNNQFNLHFFLNDTCKNAINFSEFIENIQVSDDDLENNAKMGFVSGMTKLIVDNLKQMAFNDRPIHCTDVKRETIYIKDENQWDKEKSHTAIQRGIQDITCKNMTQLFEWRANNPEYEDMDSELGEKSIVMQQNSMAGSKCNEFYPKIINNIAKETKLEKNAIEE